MANPGEKIDARNEEQKNRTKDHAMNVTERVIVEQFPFWNGALTCALPSIPARRIVVVGCGTSYFLAQTIAAAFNLNGRQAVAVPGAEWTHQSNAYLADTVDTCVLALSRSGESTETVQAVEASRKVGIPTIAITCAEGSAIERAADQSLYLPTHPEEGVVMTSSASVMLLAGLRLVGTNLDASVIDAARTAMEEVSTKSSSLLANRNHFAYLGSGPLFGLGAEGALKLQEMSLSYTQNYHSMEYRHGPISLVDRNSLVVMLYSEEMQAEEDKLAADIRSKGAVVIGLGGPGDLSVDIRGSALARLPAMLPALQIFGERVAQSKGLNTESPRHLTKVVVLA